ncbi:unnamed protein product [Nippostrongylus brasiliensis]|uniref:Uncharacterized protein n=1 Tax=Nippostrongylus brasiliensis TaxID=27835 RepID=A0A0N4YCD7_NIPBR|nr:unnamed protein product [Nippostrongylus brasiliensis]
MGGRDDGAAADQGRWLEQLGVWVRPPIYYRRENNTHHTGQLKCSRAPAGLLGAGSLATEWTCCDGNLASSFWMQRDAAESSP